MLTAAKPLKCGVVGAGIAGLAASLALRRAGHEVEIFERSSFKCEIGAAITLTPNANLILDRWGFDAKKACETDKFQSRHLHPATLGCKVHNNFADVKEKFGHNFNAYHRVDLHKGLHDLTMGPSQTGPVPVLHLDSEVTEVDCEAGLIKLKNGTEVQKDLVVTADGFKSQFIETVTGMVIPVLRNGKSVYRTLIPMEKLLGDPVVRPIFENQPSGQLASSNFRTGVLWICYPCRNDEVMNVAIFHDTREDQKDNDDWNSPARTQDALDQLRKGGWNPAWEAFIKHADHMNCYTLGIRDVLPSMVRGKAVLIGDAAHCMMPTFAQGGCTALEDAAALEIFFSACNFDTGTGSVEQRLELWNQFRMPRVCVTQLLSNAMAFNQPTEQVQDSIRKYYSGPLPPSSTSGWDDHVQNFFYSYDVFAEAEKAIQHQDAQGRMPEGLIQHFGLKADPDTTNE